MSAPDFILPLRGLVSPSPSASPAPSCFSVPFRSAERSFASSDYSNTTTNEIAENVSTSHDTSNHATMWKAPKRSYASLSDSESDLPHGQKRSKTHGDIKFQHESNVLNNATKRKRPVIESDSSSGDHEVPIKEAKKQKMKSIIEPAPMMMEFMSKKRTRDDLEEGEIDEEEEMVSTKRAREDLEEGEILSDDDEVIITKVITKETPAQKKQKPLFSGPLAAWSGAKPAEKLGDHVLHSSSITNLEEQELTKGGLIKPGQRIRLESDKEAETVPLTKGQERAERRKNREAAMRYTDKGKDVVMHVDDEGRAIGKQKIRKHAQPRPKPKPFVPTVVPYTIPPKKECPLLHMPHEILEMIADWVLLPEPVKRPGYNLEQRRTFRRPTRHPKTGALELQKHQKMIHTEFMTTCKKVHAAAQDILNRRFKVIIPMRRVSEAGHQLDEPNRKALEHVNKVVLRPFRNSKPLIYRKDHGAMVGHTNIGFAFCMIVQHFGKLVREGKMDADKKEEIGIEFVNLYHDRMPGKEERDAQFVKKGDAFIEVFAKELKGVMPNVEVERVSLMKKKWRLR